MRILSKQSKKELEERITELENELQFCKKQEDHQLPSKQNIALQILTQYCKSENLIMMLLLDKETKNLDTVVPNTSNILKPSYNSLQDLLSDFQPEATEQILVYINKLWKNRELKLPIKVLKDKGSSKESRLIELTISPLDNSKSIFYIVLKDITSFTKQSRDIERIKEKAEEADKLKSVILSNISHYIRPPLNSVNGFAELLANGSFDESKRIEYIDIIKRQSKRILTLIDDLSEVAKLECGNINISKTPSNIKLMLNELLVEIKEYRAEKRKEKVEVISNFPSESIELLTDSGRLLQALNHILYHTLRMTHSGKIEIGYAFLESQQKVQFYVQDSSYGMSKDEQKSIFNKFTTIENDESTRVDDPGLGLTIAKAIIKALGGRIWVESEENKGTRFIFNIPFEPVGEHIYENILDEKEDRAEHHQYEWSNKVILVVDDEEVNAMFLDAVFQETNAQIIFAKNGVEAIELCKSINKIDLILMDIKMPVLNGLMATQEIRKFNSKVPIIAQTALASDSDKINCVNAGCNASITKPIEIAKLLKAVNRYMPD